MSLAGSSLAVCQDGCIVATDDALHDGAHTVLVQCCLRRLRVIDVIKRERTIGSKDDLRLVGDFAEALPRAFGLVFG